MRGQWMLTLKQGKAEYRMAADAIEQQQREQECRQLHCSSQGLVQVQAALHTAKQQQHPPVCLQHTES